MANYNAVTNAQIKEMQELRAAGFSRTDIAKELGVSKMTVSRYAPSYKFISDKDVKKNGRTTANGSEQQQNCYGTWMHVYQRAKIFGETTRYGKS